MSRAALGQIGRHLERLFGAGTAVGLDDALLLDLFIRERDEHAFAAIVDRHGPMVWATCKNSIRHHADAEDAFQATFLVLARRARAIRDPGRLGPWLHGVAQRVARKALVRADRERRRERAMLSLHQPEDSAPPETDDLAPLLHAEIARLPRRYREVVVLCDLEGRSREDAAAHLGCPVGTVKGRLSRGRERLRGALARRGMAPSVAVVSAVLEQQSQAAVPAALAAATTKFALSHLSGPLLAVGVNGVALSLTMETLSAMLTQRLATAAGLVLLGSVATIGAATQLSTTASDKPVPAGTTGEPVPPQKHEDSSRPLTVEDARARLAEIQKRVRTRESEAQRLTHEKQFAELADLAASGRLVRMGSFEHEPKLINQAWGVSAQILGDDLKAADDRDEVQRAFESHQKRMKELCDRVAASYARAKEANDELIRQAGEPAQLDAPFPPYALLEEDHRAMILAQADLWLAQARAGETPLVNPLSSPGGLEPGSRDLPVANATPNGSSGADADDVAGAHGELDERTRAILAALEKPVSMPFTETPLEDVIKYIKTVTEDTTLPGGIPVYIDPNSLEAAAITLSSPVTIELEGIRLKTALRMMLKQLGLSYFVKEGVVWVGTTSDRGFAEEAGLSDPELPGGVRGYGLVPAGGFTATQIDEYRGANPPTSATGGGGFR